MKRCKKCEFDVYTVRKTCPLCLNVLETDGGEYEKIFPTPDFVPKGRGLFLRILAFISIIAIFMSVVINVMTYTEGGTLWSVIVIFNIGYFWLLIKSTFKKEGNVPFRLVIQTIAISLLTYVIDYFTGNSGWAINYVVPFIAMASLLSIISISIGSKRRYINYFLHILTAIFLCTIPIIMYLIGWITILWPALSAVTLAFVSIIGMIIIGDKDTREEIKKRFHI